MSIIHCPSTVRLQALQDALISCGFRLHPNSITGEWDLLELPTHPEHHGSDGRAKCPRYHGQLTRKHGMQEISHDAPA